MKKVDFSETIAACDLKLIELITTVSIEGQGYFLTLAQGHLGMKIKLDLLSSRWAIFSQILNVSL